MKNWKEIVRHFDTIKSVDVHNEKPVIAVTGIKKGKLTAIKAEYTYRPVALEVSKKVSNFIGI